MQRKNVKLEMNLYARLRQIKAKYSGMNLKSIDNNKKKRRGDVVTVSNKILLQN